MSVRTMFDPACRRGLLDRLRRLDPAAPGRWGELTAPRMLAHLKDQMEITLGERACGPMGISLRSGLLRAAFLYVLPMPRIDGPPEAFASAPTTWAADLDALEGLTERFAARGTDGGPWAEHPVFGPMSGPEWGVLCYRHFHYHLRQFGG